ncbi:response regulator [Paenibacillus sp. YN15]|uniref:response regulator transcription factor n=1 Tax=Paenibacillus sp. YN15 TaxID=1742774 RepID=UPI000DCC7D1E|nr:response regulator [Paenibacillus sp. YN15]RAV05510.1 hypothetical protein DQG13_02490 [Paenibacillus sp. YN15]
MYKLLVVEDVKTVREAIVKSIDWGALGVEVIGALSNGEEALKQLELLQPHILLTDIGMPKMNGVELIAQVRQRSPEMKCIILSGLSEFEHARQAITLNVLDYVLKPVDPAEISRVIGLAVSELKREEGERIGRVMAEQAVKEHLPSLTGQIPVNETGGNIKKKRLVDQALEYVLAHYSRRDLTLADISSHVGLSEKYLNQIFKEVTGTTLNHTIIRLRMEKAANLMKDPAIKIYEICDQIGYTDQDYFRESFKKQYGLTPTEYRNTFL